MLGGGVDGGDPRVGEPVEEGEGARSGAAAEVHDVAGIAGEGQPRGDGGDVLGEYVRVQIEDLRLGVGVGLAGVSVLAGVSGVGRVAVGVDVRV